MASEVNSRTRPIEWAYQHMRETIEDTGNLTPEQNRKAAFYLGAVSAHEAYQVGIGTIVKREIDAFGEDPDSVVCSK